MKLTHVSASQIVKYLECPRRWAEAYLFGNKEPETEKMLAGTEIHKEGEHYLRTGEVRESKWASLIKQIKPHVPTPGTKLLLVEHKFELPTFEGGPSIKGFVDLTYKMDDGIPAIDDWKSKGSFARYCLTPEQLSVDVQLTVYAHWLWAPQGGGYEGNEIRLRHLYLKRDGAPAIKPVEVYVTREHIENCWQRHVAVIREMHEWAERVPEKSNALPAKVESCEIYGGCYYKPVCWGSNQNLFNIRTEREMDGPTLSLEERLRLKNQAKAITDPGVSILPPDAPPRDVGVSAAPETLPDRVVPNTHDKPKRGRKPIAAPSTGPTLYIDCYPFKGAKATPVLLSDWLAPMLEKVAQDYNVGDWHAIEYLHHAKGALAAEIRKNLSSLPEAIAIESNHDSASVFLECVESVASEIVGVRGRR